MLHLLHLRNRMLSYLVLSIVFLILFSLYGFWVATHPPKFITNLTPKDLGWEFEDITLTTKDNVKLSAWLVPSINKSNKVIILLHGYPADKANLLYWAEFLHQDFNLFFLDFRYFGQSHGDLTTIGFHEQKDLEAAIAYLKTHGFEKTGAMGFSMGGAVAILSASKNTGLKTIVSDSAFANLDLMGHEFYQHLFILKYPLTFLTKVWAQVFLDISPNEVSPEVAAKSVRIPILLIHSKKDQTISFENILRIKKNLQHNPKAEFFFLEEGTHGFLPLPVLEQYQQRVLEFFERSLK